MFVKCRIQQFSLELTGMYQNEQYFGFSLTRNCDSNRYAQKLIRKDTEDLKNLENFVKTFICKSYYLHL